MANTYFVDGTHDVDQEEFRKLIIGDGIVNTGDLQISSTTPFFWDDTNKRLGISTVAPAALLHVERSALALTPSANTVALFENGDGNAAIEIGAGTINESAIIFSDTTSDVGRIGYDHNGSFMVLRANGGEIMRLGSSGSVYINGTSNANMTVGLDIDQTTSTNEIIALRSTGSVAHGMTSLAETAVFGNVSKYAVANGGLNIRGFTEDEVGVQIFAAYTNSDATKGNASLGGIVLNAQERTGTTTGDNTTNSNLVVVRGVATGEQTRFILDSDGDSHQDIGTAWTQFDEYDDTVLLTDLSIAVSREDDPIHQEFSSFLKYNREALEQAKLVTFNENGHHFVNMSKLTMALVGAVRQQGDRINRLNQRLNLLEA